VAPVIEPATARLHSDPSQVVAPAAKRLKGPPLCVRAANPDVNPMAPAADVNRPGALALKRGERSPAVSRAIVTAATPKAMISETRLRVLP
jgi:hypothetical protein